MDTLIRFKLFRRKSNPITINKIPMLLPFFIKNLLSDTLFDWFFAFFIWSARKSCKIIPYLKEGWHKKQVPENSPSFFNIILMAIPAKQIANKAIERRTVFIEQN